MRLYWNDSDYDIGSYELIFMNDADEIIAKMSLRDYTCEWYKERGKPRFCENVNFEYSYCNGFSMHKCIEDDITLEQAKKQAEDWLINHFISTYENTKKSLVYMEQRANWLNEYQKTRNNT